MIEGKIKKIFSKGYGFISIPDREKDLFFHASALSKGVVFNDLKEGQAVEVADIERGEKGEQAKGVNVLY